MGHGLLCDSVKIYYKTAMGKWLIRYHPTPSSLKRVMALLTKDEEK